MNAAGAATSATAAARSAPSRRRTAATQTPAPGEHEQHEEPERDDASVGELLDRDAVRLEHVADVGPDALAGDLERPRARAERRVLRVDVHGLVPPAPAVVDVQGAEAARVVHDLGARRTGDLLVEPGDRVSDRDRKSDDTGRRSEAGGDQERAARASPARRVEAEPHAEEDKRDDERRADQHQHPEEPSIRDAIRLRRPLLDQGRTRERPAGDERRRHTRGGQEQSALDALAREQQPEQNHHDARDEPRPRERQQQRDHGDVREERAADAQGDAPAFGRAEPEPEHDGHVREHRQRVPVPDRLLEPRDSLGVGIERGEDLRREGPHENRADDDRHERRPDPGGDRAADTRQEHPEAEEDEVGKLAVEGLPAPVGADRPHDRRAGPHDEEHEPRHEGNCRTRRGGGTGRRRTRKRRPARRGGRRPRRRLEARRRSPTRPLRTPLRGARPRRESWWR